MCPESCLPPWVAILPLLNELVKQIERGERSKMMQQVRTIYFPAQNSSGDIYHAATFMILCREFLKRDVPRCIFFHDTEQTKEQALRGAHFLVGLGFSASQIEKLPFRAGHMNTRLKDASDRVIGLVSESGGRRCIEQKATTSFISNLSCKAGSAVFLRVREYVQSLTTLPRCKIVNEWTTEKVFFATRLMKLRDQRFVLVNFRVSDGANKEQNLTRPQMERILATCRDLLIKVVILDVGGDEGRYFAKKYPSEVYAMDAFPTLAAVKNWERYEKFPHLFLLLKFGCLQTCAGVIGNTSGTLDIAAFMGFRTLCVHRFKLESATRVIMPYQDLRINLQSNFMCVFDANLTHKMLGDLVLYWLHYGGNFAMRRLTTNVSLEEAGFDIDHRDRRWFVKDAAGDVFNKAFIAQFQHVKLDSKVARCAHCGFKYVRGAQFFTGVLHATRARSLDDAPGRQSRFERKSSVD